MSEEEKKGGFEKLLKFNINKSYYFPILVQLEFLLGYKEWFLKKWWHLYMVFLGLGGY